MAIREIKTRLALDGEKKFKEGMSAARREMRVLGAETNAATAAFTKNGDAAGALQAKSEGLTEKIKQQRKIVEALSQAVKDAAEKYGEADEVTDEYRIKLANATRELSKMEMELEDTTKELDGFGKKAGGIAKGGLKAAGTAIAAVGAAAIAAATGVFKLAQMASDLGEAQNVVTATFEKNGAEINKWAGTLAKSFGVGRTEATQMVGTLGAVLRGSGLTEDQFTTMSKSLVELAGDFASFYNLEGGAADAVADFKSAFAGSTETLQKYGIVMTEAVLNEYLLSQGITKKFSAMSQAEKQQVRYNYIMEQSAAVTGDFARTSGDSLANQLRVLKLQTQNLGTSLGTAFLPAVTKVVGKLQDLAGGIGDIFADGIQPTDFKKAGNLITEALLDGAAAIQKNAPAGAKAAADILSSLGGALIKAAPQLLTSLAGAAGSLLKNLATTIIKSLPAIIKGIVKAIGSLFEAIFTDNAQIREAVMEEVGSISEATEELVSAAQESAEAFTETTAAAEAQATVATRLIEQLEELTGKTERTASEQSRLEGIIAQLNEIYPDLNLAIDENNGQLNKSIDILKQTVKEQQNLARVSAYQTMVTDATEQLVKAEINLQKAREKRSDTSRKINDLERERVELSKQERELAQKINNIFGGYEKAPVKFRVEYDALQKSLGENNKQLRIQKGVIEELDEEIAENEKLIADANETIDKATGGYERLTEKMAETAEATEAMADNIATASKRGLREGLIAELEAAGPEAARLVAYIAEASDSELFKLNSAFDTHGQEAVDALMRHLDDDTLNGLGQTITRELTGADGMGSVSIIEANTAYAADKITSMMRKKVLSADYKTQLKQLGGYVTKGVADGMVRQQALRGIDEAGEKVIKRSIGAMRRGGEIRSPSRLTGRLVGKPLAQGVEKDFTAEMTAASRRMGNVLRKDIEGVGLSTEYKANKKTVTLNIYPREMTKSQTDYVIAKVNQELGAVI